MATGAARVDSIPIYCESDRIESILKSPITILWHQMDLVALHESTLDDSKCESCQAFYACVPLIAPLFSAETRKTTFPPRAATWPVWLAG